jgi:hypothetical protein
MSLNLSGEITAIATAVFAVGAIGAGVVALASFNLGVSDLSKDLSGHGVRDARVPGRVAEGSSVLLRLAPGGGKGVVARPEIRLIAGLVVQGGDAEHLVDVVRDAEAEDGL